MKCPYSKSCPEYESERLLCCFAYNFCKTKKYFDRVKEDSKKARTHLQAEHLRALGGQVKSLDSFDNVEFWRSGE